MKQGIHPNWLHNTIVTCSCGASFTTGSSEPTIQVDICSQCHPFFTGEMRFVDRQGRVDKFNKAVAAAKSDTPINKRAKKAQKAAGDTQEALSYRQILQQQKQAKAKTTSSEQQ